jgi:hypothetical protein
MRAQLAEAIILGAAQQTRKLVCLDLLWRE